MNKKIIKLTIAFFVSLLSIGCEEYLDIPSDAMLTEERVFTSYNSFQGYIDPCYSMITDNNFGGDIVCNNIGTEATTYSDASPARHVVEGLDYRFLMASGGRSIWNGYGGSSTLSAEKQGLYQWWPIGSRIANISLKNLSLLTDATQEQRDLIEGQVLFFRAYLNFEIARAFGSVPYLDEVYIGTNDRVPRYWTDELTGKKDCQAVFEKASRDLDRAYILLPVAWESNNTGRITKGAAKALKAKVLLYAGSPLYEETSVLGKSKVLLTKETPFNAEYMRRSAFAADSVIKLGIYGLTPFKGIDADEAKSPGAGYRKMFTTIDNSIPYTEECIFQRWNSPTGNRGQSTFQHDFGRIYAKGPLATNAPGNGYQVPLLRYMDKFEMIDGTQYKPGNKTDGGYDDDFSKFNLERDPRFDFNYRLHKETIGNYTSYFDDLGKVYDPKTKGPFMMTKYWYPLVDVPNAQWGQYNYATPCIRYAEVLLFYAEAVFELTGNPDAKIEGGTYTAREALNLVRNRAGMPNYNPLNYSVARTTHGEFSSDHPFRMALRNERAVEFAYEGHFWFDMRRWKRFHSMDDQLWILNFNKDWNTATRVFYQPFKVEERHYWLPFPTSHTQIFDGFSQNPGW